ncbi:MAG TPA: hypothetical protein VHE12_12500 [bacterium]|nr:hypothetical protein [bacterium]
MAWIKYGLMENAIDSLDHCVAHLVVPKNVSIADLKRGILDAVHVIELLLKERLRRVNEALIWTDIDKYPRPDASKAGLQLTVKRLQQIAKLDFEEDDIGAINLAAEIRNKFIHYEIEMDDKDLKGLLGRLLKFIFKFSELHLQKDLSQPFKRERKWPSIVELIACWPEYSHRIAGEFLEAGFPLWYPSQEGTVSDQIEMGIKKIKNALKESYYVSKELRVDNSDGDQIGFLQVLLDLRLKGRTDFHGRSLEESGFGYALEDSFLNAILRLVSNDGEELDKTVLDRPLATIEQAAINGTGPTVFLKIDYSTGVGSYSGPVTYLTQAFTGKIVWVLAKKIETGKYFEISMMKSLKTDWTIKDRSTILKIACRPTWNEGKKDIEFITTFTRFSYEGSGWLERSISVEKFWEADDENYFSNEQDFP